jgi:hypothetical protein
MLADDCGPPARLSRDSALTRSGGNKLIRVEHLTPIPISTGPKAAKREFIGRRIAKR